MADIAVLQMPAFKRVYKKLAASHQAVVDDAVRAIVTNPGIGEAKKGDLAGVYVHKFPLNRQQMLLAFASTSSAAPSAHIWARGCCRGSARTGLSRKARSSSA